METFEIKREIIQDSGYTTIILGESQLATLKASAKTEKNKDMAAFYLLQANQIEIERKANKDKIREVTITLKKPSPEDRVEIRSASRDSNGVYDAEREPLAVAVRLTQSWSLLDADGKPLEVNADNIRHAMPICLLDAIYSEVYPYLYPATQRLAFLPPPVAWSQQTGHSH